MKKKRSVKKKGKFKPTILFYYRNTAFACIETKSYKFLGYKVYNSGGIEFGGIPFFDNGKTIKDLLNPKHFSVKVSVDDAHFMECRKAKIETVTISSRQYVKMRLKFVKLPTLLMMT